LISSTTLCETFLILRRTGRDIIDIITYVRKSLYKVAVVIEM